MMAPGSWLPNNSTRCFSSRAGSGAWDQSVAYPTYPFEAGGVLDRVRRSEYSVDRIKWKPSFSYPMIEKYFLPDSLVLGATTSNRPFYDTLIEHWVGKQSELNDNIVIINMT